MDGKFQAWLDELRSRTSLEEVVSEYVPLKQKGRRYWGCCPFHNEKTPSFSVDTEAQMYYCFGCHKGGTVINFVMDMERMEFMDAVRLLADRAHMEVPARERRPGDTGTTRDERDRMYEANRLAARYYHSLLWTGEGAEALNSFSPSLDLRYTLSDGFDLVAFGRRAFRAPTFNELYYPGYGNPDLKPEDAWLTDLGIDWHRALGNWTLGAKVDGFYNFLKDKITSAPMPDDPNVWLPYNIGRVEAWGADVVASARYDDGCVAGGFSARYARQNALDKTPGSYTFDQQIPYVARHTVVLAGDIAYAGWKLDALWNWRGGRFDASGQMPNWNSLDLSLRKSIKLCEDSALTLFVTAKDLLDCRYDLVRDYPMPGRSVLGGIEFKF